MTENTTTEILLKLFSPAVTPVFQTANTLHDDSVARQVLPRLVVLTHAARNLAKLIEAYFSAHLEIPDDEEVALFIQSVGFHCNNLIDLLLQQLRINLNARQHILVAHRQLPQKPRENVYIKDILDMAESAAYDMQVAMCRIPMHSTRSVIEVPNASPFDLFYQRACSRKSVENVKEKLGEKHALLMLQKRQIFDFAPIVEIPDPLEFIVLPADFGDSLPSMIFACAHPGVQGFVVGTSEAKWTGFPEVELVTRNMRDRLLQNYIPLADIAYAALRGKEEAITAEILIANPDKKAESKEIVVEARRRAISKMQHDPRSLGGDGDMGLAIRVSDWGANQPCYACQGMFKYQVARKWRAKEEKSYLLAFDWQKRGGYAHSCAESSAMAKCMVRN